MQQERISLRAPAKINLFLRVTGRRADGYHTLETLMHKVDLCDELELRLCRQGIRLRCQGSPLPEDKGNLVYRAAELYLQTLASQSLVAIPGVEITLKKNIPVAAGLGGGSSDAAATLRGLNMLLGGGFDREQLATLGLQLGADVPFFLGDAVAAVATGIGEILTPVAPLSGYSVLLVNPGFPVSTRWVYQTFALTKNKFSSNLKNSWQRIDCADQLEGRSAQAVALTAMTNDLEAVTLSRFPEVGQLKEDLVAQGAAVALMSGSGPTVFGLFADQGCAEASYALCKRRFIDTYLISPSSAMR